MLTTLTRAGGQRLPALPAQAARELTALEEALGGRQGLVQALTYAPQDKDVRYLLGLLGDPDHQALSLADVCHMGQIMPGHLVDLLSRGKDARVQLVARHLIAERLPGVVQDVMQRAAPFEDTCPACNGTGTHVPEPVPGGPAPTQEPCKTCQGHGVLRYDPDATCRELALEMGGLVGKGGGGIQITNTQQVAVAQGTGGTLGLESFQELVDAVLYGQTTPGGPPSTPPSDDAPLADGEILGVEDESHAAPDVDPAASADGT